MSESALSESVRDRIDETVEDNAQRGCAEPAGRWMTGMAGMAALEGGRFEG